MRYILIVMYLLNLLCAQDIEPTEAPLNPEYVKYLEIKHSSQLHKYSIDDAINGHIPHPALINSQISKTFKNNVLFPSKYDLRDEGLVTPVRDQGNCGTCWIFATIASIESYWKKLGLSSYDLSEDNIAHEHGFEGDPCDGGSRSKVTPYLVRGDGPISESDDPYELGKPLFSPQGIVTQARFLPENIDVIKQYITDYGAAFSVVRYLDSFYDYYNANSNSFYYSDDDTTSAGHCIALIGWDDNKLTDGGTGAWIAKNSWGTNFGDNGYFYISYNDVRVNKFVTLWPGRIEFNDHMRIYHYDKLGWINSSGWGDGPDYALVKYIINSDETLVKIGTYNKGTDASVKFEIYNDFNNNLLSNKLLSTQTFSCDYPGYYSFDLPTPFLVLTAGQEIYVKIEYTTPYSDYPIPFERFSEDYANPGIESGVFWNSNTGDGTQSTWFARGNDIVDKERDPCVKLYTMETSWIATEQEKTHIKNFNLNQNYPNPFNPSTIITFDLSEETDVKFSIYDMTGRLIKELINQPMTIGNKTIFWNGKDKFGHLVSGGIYFYKIKAGDFTQTKKMILMK